MKQTHQLTSLLLAFLLLGTAAFAQEPATWSAKADKRTAKPGDKLVVTVTAKINDKWHVYSTTPMSEGPSATTIEFPASSGLKRQGKIRQPKPIVKHDENFGIDTEYYEEGVAFEVPVIVTADAKSATRLVIKVNFMACNDRVCIPPKTIDVPLELAIEGKVLEPAGTAVQQAGEKRDTPKVTVSQTPAANSNPDASLGYGDQKDVANARKQGLWSYIGLAMSVGALSLLTPCVFPMIPITVSFFTKREQATRSAAVRDAVIYSFGIIFTFTVLGILLAVIFGASGINQFAANPWMNLLIAAFFLIFALNLFGLFEIVVPSGVLTKLTNASGSGRGIVSLLLMGLTFTLTSFTCTVPFIGTVMVAASSGEIWWSVVGMLAYSTVFAFPFFLLALFPSWLKSMPKSGGWLNSVKVVMGFLEMAAAMKFLSNVDLIWSFGILSRDLFLSFWVGIGGVVTMYLLGIFQLPHDTKPERIGVFRMLFGIFFLGISVYLYTGLGGKPLGEIDAFMPPMDYKATIQAAGGSSQATPSGQKGEQWLTNFGQALEKAKAQSKPVFIDFTGFACTNCRWMEANVFSLPEVKALLDNFVIVRLYTDGQGAQYDANRKLQEGRFGTVALPLYVIVSNGDALVGSFPGLTRKPAEFVDFLKSGLGKAKASAAL